MLIIEHNLDVIKMADWIIDLGPEGGDGGGNIVIQGTPEQVAASPESYTGRYLEECSEGVRREISFFRRGRLPAAIDVMTKLRIILVCLLLALAGVCGWRRVCLAEARRSV